MTGHDDEITLEQAAKLSPAKLCEYSGWRIEGVLAPDSEHLANLPGAEATAVLEAMLAAGRAGKVVRG